MFRRLLEIYRNTCQRSQSALQHPKSVPDFIAAQTNIAAYSAASLHRKGTLPRRKTISPPLRDTHRNLSKHRRNAAEPYPRLSTSTATQISPPQFYTTLRYDS